MSSPAQNVDLKQTVIARVTKRNSSGNPPVTQTWQQVVSLMLDKRPKSLSNPVRKDGTRPLGPWTHSASRTTFGGGFYSLMEVDKFGNWWSTLAEGLVTVRASNQSVLVDHTLSKRLLNDSKAKALSGISASKSQFNVAAREAKGTVKLMAEYCQQSIRGVKSLSRALSSRDPRRYLPPGYWKKVPGNYLGYLYGIKPLADDMANGLDQLSGLSKRNMAFGYWARSGRTESNPLSEIVSTPAYANNFRAVGGQRRSVARCGYYYQFPQWWIDEVPIVTPFSDAWELTRLSFVLDWVLPVGNWIGAMEAAQFDPYFREGFETYSTEEIVRGPFRPIRVPGPGQSYDEVMVNEGYVDRRYEMVRTVLGPGSKPSTRVSFPSFRDYLGLDHAAQSLALLSQVMKTPPSRW